MTKTIKIHLSDDFEKSLAPIPAIRKRDWFEDNSSTAGHAVHCLPLSMANGLGYYILSPGTFIVSWDGDVTKRAKIQHIEKSSHYEVDDHATFGGFTVQSKFIPVTENPGDFIYIKGIPNERDEPYTCMEAAIESWWSVSNFGLVFLLKAPGEFLIPMGKPIAQMFLYSGADGATKTELVEGYPAGHAHWLKRRNRKGYVKDLDYMRGENSAGIKIQTHITKWRDAEKYGNH